MSRQYNRTWPSKKMIVNFNQKPWRQDFADYVKNKNFWDETRVTRSRLIADDLYNKKIKSFEVYNRYGGNVKVVYEEENKIITTSDEHLVKQYFEERKMYVRNNLSVASQDKE